MTKWITVRGYPIRIYVRGNGIAGLPLTIAEFERLPDKTLARLSAEDRMRYGAELGSDAR
jgi:hypothetical protein